MTERSTVHGPYDTRAQARAGAAPLIATERAADPGNRPMTDAIRAARLQARIDYLEGALDAAGVQLGAFDKRIVAWLADWETETLQVLVGWIERAHVDQAHADAAAGVDPAAAAQDFDNPSLLDDPTVPADLARFPWRVYGLPRPGDKGQPWLVNAFTTKQGAEQFAGQHSEHGPLTITCADEALPACPCDCTAHFCRCSNPETCTCAPTCPVCDQDGGA